MMSPRSTFDIAQQIIEQATAKKFMIVLAESCTGGLIAAALTDVAGSSEVIERGLVTYSNQAKMDLLNVPEVTLVEYGAVSAETARAMAVGALTNARRAELALSVTGIAGPGGGSSEKPVGLVYFAVMRRDQIAHDEHHVFQGNRREVRHSALEVGLNIILNQLK